MIAGCEYISISQDKHPQRRFNPELLATRFVRLPELFLLLLLPVAVIMRSGAAGLKTFVIYLQPACQTRRGLVSCELRLREPSNRPAQLIKSAVIWPPRDALWCN